MKWTEQQKQLDGQQGTRDNLKRELPRESLQEPSKKAKMLNNRQIEEVKKDINSGVSEVPKQRKLGSYEVIPLLQKTISNVMKHKDPNKITEGEIMLIENCLEQVILYEVPIEVLVKHKIGLLVKGFYDFVHPYPQFEALDKVTRCAFKKLKKGACEELFGDNKVLHYSPKNEQANKSLSKKSPLKKSESKLNNSKANEAMEVKGDTKHEDRKIVQAEKQEPLYQISKQSLRNASKKLKRKGKSTKRRVATRSESIVDLSNKAGIHRTEDPRSKLRSSNENNKSIKKRNKEITKRSRSRKTKANNENAKKRTRSETGATKKNNSKKAPTRNKEEVKANAKSARKKSKELMEDTDSVESEKSVNRSQSVKQKKKVKRSVSANLPKKNIKRKRKTGKGSAENKSKKPKKREKEVKKQNKKDESEAEPMEDIEEPKATTKKSVKKKETSKSVKKKTKRDSSMKSVKDDQGKKAENSKLLTTQKETKPNSDNKAKDTNKNNKKTSSNKQDESVSFIILNSDSTPSTTEKLEESLEEVILIIMK